MNVLARSTNSGGCAASWSSDSCKPCATVTLRPLSARTSFCSWLPDTQIAVPASTRSMTRRSTPGVSGPRSTRSPTNTAVRPSGWRGSGPSKRQPSSRSSVSSSERQPCTSPMMSNGPVSSVRSDHAFSYVITAWSISSVPRSMCTRRNPSRWILPSERRRSLRCRITTPAPKSRSGRPALRSIASSSGTSRTIASASTSWRLARSIRLLRAWYWTLVASTTVNRPLARRTPTMWCSRSKAAGVADWSLTSSETRPRQ